MKTLLVNGKAWLKKNYFAEAVGFDSLTGRIDFVGSNSAAVDLSPEYDELIDVKGRLILPAFMDGHCHLAKGSLVNKELNLRGISTKNEFINQLKKYYSETKGWIQGGYFAESGFKEDFKIDRNLLDEICPDRPVFISRFDNHSAILNSKAIELSGIAGQRDKFPSSDLVLDSDANLTGQVKEDARTFVLNQIPKTGVNEQALALKDEIAKLHSFGITSVADITLPEDLEVYYKLLKDNDLNLFIDSRLPFKEIENINEHKTRFKMYRENIKFHSFKAFYDGSLSSETAYFHDNYIGRDSNGSRTEFVNSGDFKKYGEMIDRSGYRMSVHAIGDKAVTELLDFNGYLRENLGVKDRRFRIEHAQHIQPDDLDRFKKLDVIASVQPWHLFSDAKTAGIKLLNPQYTHNYKLLLDRNVTVCFGTDFPIVGENPLINIYYAMTRKAEGMESATGGEFYPEYRVGLEDCLTCYTINNAYASGEEVTRGSIRENKIADLIVLDDLFSMTPDEIKDAGVSMTFFRGERVY